MNSMAEPTVTLEAPHLRIVQRHAAGGNDHVVHLIENPDLGAVLSRGGSTSAHGPSGGMVGTLVITLGEDGEDTDVVHYDTNGGGADESLAQAQEAIMACRDALRRMGADR